RCSNRSRTARRSRSSEGGCSCPPSMPTNSTKSAPFSWTFEWYGSPSTPLDVEWSSDPLAPFSINSPFFREKKVRLTRRQIQNVAYMRSHEVDAIDPLRQFAGQSHTHGAKESSNARSACVDLNLFS